jgi:hypothetical protein
MVGKPKRFSYKQMVKIAYIRVRSNAALARMFKCHPTTIRRIRFAMPLSYLIAQNALIAKTILALRTCPPDFAFSTRLWDETGERLCLSLDSSLKSHQSASTWQVMVQRRRYVWGWIRERAGKSTQ